MAPGGSTTEVSSLTEVVRARLDIVRDRIARAGGDPARVRVVAVTKGFGLDAVQAALACGLVDLGESYAQELLGKVEALRAPRGVPRWHAVGRVQSNKVKRLARVVDVWQSVDRPSLVDALAAAAPGAVVYVQVNVSGEATKGGVAPEGTAELVTRATDAGLRVEGLMAVGRLGEPEGARAGFARLRALADELGLVERSMGMSGDLEVAVQEGSTMVRLGEALFGPRPPRSPALFDGLPVV